MPDKDDYVIKSLKKTSYNFIITHCLRFFFTARVEKSEGDVAGFVGYIFASSVFKFRGVRNEYHGLKFVSNKK